MPALCHLWESTESAPTEDRTQRNYANEGNEQIEIMPAVLVRCIRSACIIFETDQILSLLSMNALTI